MIPISLDSPIPNRYNFKTNSIISDERLSELEALLANTTPGPWFFSGTLEKQDISDTCLSEKVCEVFPASNRISPCICVVNDYNGVEAAANAAFIVEARKAIPELLQELKRLRCIEY